MLTKDPDARITLAQIKEHSWVTEHGEFPMPSTEYVSRSTATPRELALTRRCLL